MPCLESGFIQAFGDDTGTAFKDITNIVFDLKEVNGLTNLAVAGLASFREKVIPASMDNYVTSYAGQAPFTAAFMYVVSLDACTVSGAVVMKTFITGIKSIKFSEDGRFVGMLAYDGSKEFFL